MGVIKFSGKMGPNSLKAKPRYVSGEIKNPAGGPPIHVTTNPATKLEQLVYMLLCWALYVACACR